MKDWFCSYQFYKRYAEESAKCPHRSAEKVDGAISYGNFGDLYEHSLGWQDIDRPRAGYTWQDTECYACNACEGQCPIYNRLIEERFGSIENYARWKAETEHRQKELAETEKQREAEQKAREIRSGRLLIRGGITYELNEELEDLLMQAQVGNVPESDFYEALQRAKEVS